MYDPTTFSYFAGIGGFLLRRALSAFGTSSSRARFLVIALISLSAPLVLRSQVSAPSQIAGVVTDQTGAAIPAAEVVFTSASINATQLTDERGEFVFSQISVAAGVVKVSAAGFQAQSIEWHSAD